MIALRLSLLVPGSRWLASMIARSGDGPMTTRRRSRGVLGSWVVGAVFNFEDDSYPMEPTVIRKRCVRTIELHAKAIGITTDGLRDSFRNHEYEQIQGRPGDVATAVRGRGRAAIEVVSDKRARGFTQKRRNAAVCASQHGRPCLRAPTCTIYMYVWPNFKQGTAPSFRPQSVRFPAYYTTN